MQEVPYSTCTSKACQRAANAQHDEQAGEPNAAMMEILTAIQGQVSEVKGQMSKMDGRMKQMEGDKHEEARIAEEQEVQIVQGNERQADNGGAKGLATPSSVRSNIRLIARVTERLNRMSMSDLEGDEDNNIPRNRVQGKKSGSLMLASDVVRKQSDWPHLHVKRMVNSRRRPLAYADLKVEEFAYGFIEMLNPMTSKLDYMCMIEILKIVLQDAIDFTWSNVLGFYKVVGLEVEYGSLTWEEVERINKMTVYSRTIFPVNREQRNTCE